MNSSSSSDVIHLLLVAAGGGGSSSQPAAASPVNPGGGIAPVGPGTSSSATDDFTPGHRALLVYVATACERAK